MKTCRNCNAPLGPEDEVCPACGAEALKKMVVERNGIETVSADDAVETVVVTRTPVPEDLRTALAERYELIEMIGRGGMGEVYRGVDRKTDEVVAVKVMKKKYSADPDFAERFKREAKILEALDHPNIVRLLRSGEAGGYLYFVMPFINGRTLRARLREEGKLDPAEAARIVREVCRALEYAHDNKVIHRDIKPDNIMEDGKGRVYLTDFGISKAAAESTMTQTGAFMGTAEYMSPEQCRDSKEVDGRSDLYSLGIVMYEMLTGHVPFAGEMMAVRHSQIYERPKSVRRKNRAVPKGLARIVERLLSKEREKRPAKANELEWDLILFLKQEEKRQEKKKKPEGRVMRALRYARTMPRLVGMEMALAALVLVTTVIGGYMYFNSIHRQFLRQAGSRVMIGGIPFRYIPAGEFIMGSPPSPDFPDESPTRAVKISSFYMSECEITQAQYEDLMRSNPSKLRDPGYAIETVSYAEALRFCTKFGDKHGVKARLPREAEWEYAAKAGTASKYYWGSEPDGAYCWYDKNSNNIPHLAGIKRPNAWGLFDMAGNLWEWCMDWYDEKAYLSPSRENPVGPQAGTLRVIRGGSRGSEDFMLRSAYRNAVNPDSKNDYLGFRIVVQLN